MTAANCATAMVTIGGDKAALKQQLAIGNELNQTLNFIVPEFSWHEDGPLSLKY